MALASLPSSQNHHQHNLCNTSHIHAKLKNNKLLNTFHMSFFRVSKKTPKIIAAAAGATTNEGRRIQKPARLRTSNYPKTLSAIYADMNDLCREGLIKEALQALDNTQFRRGIPVDSVMYEILLQACTKTKALELGKKIHAHMKLNRLDRYESLRIKLVKMYASCGNIEDARQVFDKTPQPSFQIWNAMLKGYVSKGFYEKDALELYHQMRLAGVKVDKNTFSCVLKACGAMSDLQQGKKIHEDIIGIKIESNVVVGTALMDMYMRCDSVEDARRVFDKMPQRNVITWTAMIKGLTHSGLWDEALDCFRGMQLEGEKPNSVTLVSVLPACGNMGVLQQIKQIHGYIIRNGFDVYAFVDNTLIGMYSKCGYVEAARKIFDKMLKRDVVSYSTMILGYAENRCANEALEIFCQMERDGVKPNFVTVANVLPACGDLAALQKGKEIHAYIIRCGFEFNAFVSCALIDMYSKCARTELARYVFDKMSEKDVDSWTTMIVGYGINGDGTEALKLFNQMQEAELEPNYLTLLAVLSACNHAGLVDEGCQCFQSISQSYHIAPRVEHYTCMVDLLAHIGHLNEAFDLIQNMPLEPDASVWGALMGACRIHCNIEIGEGAQHLLELESQNVRNRYE